MLWIWETRAQDEGQVRITSRPEAIDRLGLHFGRGVPLGPLRLPVIEIYYRANSAEQLTDCLIAPATTGEIFNARLRDLLAALGVDNIEYFPVAIINEATGGRNENYRLANLVGAVACVDRLKSRLGFDEGDGSITTIDRLELDERAATGRKLFRLAEFPPLVIVSDEIKRAVEAAGISGVSFYAPESYRL